MTESFLSGDEYLVLHRDFTSRVREIIPAWREYDESRIRSILLGVMRGQQPRGEEPSPLGPQRTYRVAIREVGPCEIVFVWGRDKTGRAKMAPDGRKQCVFATAIRRLGETGG